MPGITDSQLAVKGPITISGDGGGRNIVAVTSGSTVKVNNLTLEGCTSDTENERVLTIANSTITGSGAQAFLNSGSMTFSNNTFSNNVGDILAPSVVSNEDWDTDRN